MSDVTLAAPPNRTVQLRKYRRALFDQRRYLVPAHIRRALSALERVSEATNSHTVGWVLQL
jgi:hypothetical protein